VIAISGHNQEIAFQYQGSSLQSMEMTNDAPSNTRGSIECRIDCEGPLSTAIQAIIVLSGTKISLSETNFEKALSFDHQLTGPWRI
jgi:hypothetical protein